MNWFTRYLQYRKLNPRTWWDHFTVSWNDEFVEVKEIHRFKNKTSNKINWSSIQSICFKDGGLGCDVFYLFTAFDEHPVMVPIEAKGGQEFWNELTKRNLFPKEISGSAIQSTGGQIFWWPPKT